MTSSNLTKHHQYLLQALALAEKRRGYCAPNPAVGAILLHNDEKMAEGYHFANGHPHAEAEVLSRRQPEWNNMTLYVTLEPCCHHDKKTPPCTDLIIASGVKQVFFAHQDPNPKVSGKGAARLKAAGIHCEQIELPEITKFYNSYGHWWQTGTPWVTAKLALTLDGKIAGPQGKPWPITGEALRTFTHEQRRRSDAILTTIKTILQDDPQLNVRLGQETESKPLYILDSQLRLPLNAQIFKTASAITLFHEAEAPLLRKRALQEAGVSCIEVAKNPEKKLSLTNVLAIIGEQGKYTLWVEAGGECFQGFLEAKLLQQAFLYVSPKWLGAEAQSAFEKQFNLLTNAKAICWRAVEQEAICEINF